MNASRFSAAAPWLVSYTVDVDKVTTAEAQLERVDPTHRGVSNGRYSKSIPASAAALSSPDAINRIFSRFRPS